MQIATGTVINGRIVVDDLNLPEGAVVTVLSRGADEPFELTPAEEQALSAAIAEIERGDHVSLDELLSSLPQRHPA